MASNEMRAKKSHVESELIPARDQGREWIGFLHRPQAICAEMNLLDFLL
jgi:hypothetical protein